ncbi:hypothetical protein BDB00DRAFT_932738 [Zychaea mexicana]|uniref:uncharacterized protein n=1 Tax=Zychaea mexicana TaxID=64656 RepID=UPI0022FE7469|nr:uncharacterized protein BDB00DRAFT_932738 [Zychaea mexicana]KAI9488460.1 hypothetical protein BDB00DRAFT_932738 [Zychaea mexicana]
MVSRKSKRQATYYYKRFWMQKERELAKVETRKSCLDYVYNVLRTETDSITNQRETNSTSSPEDTQTSSTDALTFSNLEQDIEQLDQDSPCLDKAAHSFRKRTVADDKQPGQGVGGSAKQRVRQEAGLGGRRISEAALDNSNCIYWPNDLHPVKKAIVKGIISTLGRLPAVNLKDESKLGENEFTCTFFDPILSRLFLSNPGQWRAPSLVRSSWLQRHLGSGQMPWSAK